MKIAIVGSHGVGKTTLCRKLREVATDDGFSSIIITEKARECPYPINDGMCPATAKWVVCSQIKAELEAEATNSFDYIICDRSCLDTMLYLENCTSFEVQDLRLADFALSHIETYDKIILVLSSYENLEDDGIRSQDIEFHIAMDESFEERFEKMATMTIYARDIFDGPEPSEELCKRILSC